MAALDPLPSPSLHLLASEALLGAIVGAAAAAVVNLYAFFLAELLVLGLGAAAAGWVSAACRAAIVFLPLLGAAHAARQAMRALPAPR